MLSQGLEFKSRAGQKKNSARFSFLEIQKETGISSFFGFGFIAPSSSIRDKLAAYLDERGVQVRPIVSGNIAKHPLSSFMHKSDTYICASLLHERGFFIGNHHVDFSENIHKFINLLLDFN